MKNVSYLLLLLICFACNAAEKSEETAATPSSTTPADQPTATAPEPATVPQTEPQNPASVLLGTYVGMFEASKYDEDKRPTWANKITISIDKIEDDLLYGHSVVAGNDRPFSGTVSQVDDHFEAQVEEPGDDRYDGTFEFKVYPDKKRMAGIWVANNAKLAVFERKYELEKRAFEYDPSTSLKEENVYFDVMEVYGSYNETTGEAEFITEAIFSKNASAEALKKEDVENMHRGDLEVIRNAIYARHGYTFKNRKMRYVFNYVPWYMPMYTDIRDQLTALELQNIDLLKRYEQHAARYYDSFGR